MEADRMSAYVIANFTVTDPVTFEDYRLASLETIAAAGGRLRIRSIGTPLHGSLPHQIVALIEFPDRASAAAWYAGDAYQELLAVRDRSATMTFTLFDGLP
jgi:uncharacterized protein (DUF1330 family)